VLTLLVFRKRTRGLASCTISYLKLVLVLIGVCKQASKLCHHPQASKLCKILRHALRQNCSERSCGVAAAESRATESTRHPAESSATESTDHEWHCPADLNRIILMMMDKPEGLSKKISIDLKLLC
jgi:hypothetical protein